MNDDVLLARFNTCITVSSLVAQRLTGEVLKCNPVCYCSDNFATCFGPYYYWMEGMKIPVVSVLFCSIRIGFLFTECSLNVHCSFVHSLFWKGLIISVAVLSVSSYLSARVLVELCSCVVVGLLTHSLTHSLTPPLAVKCRIYIQMFANFYKKWERSALKFSKWLEIQFGILGTMVATYPLRTCLSVLGFVCLCVLGFMNFKVNIMMYHYCDTFTVTNYFHALSLTH